jgi:hypothetical protein
VTIRQKTAPAKSAGNIAKSSPAVVLIRMTKSSASI